MKTKSRKWLTVCSIVIVISILGYFGVKYCLDKNLEREKQELQDIIDKYGVLEKESIEVTVAKFNSQIEDNSDLNHAMDKYLTIDNEQYWYGLYEGVYCFAIPLKFTGDITKDITKTINIYYDKSSNYKEEVMKYIRFLIKANNDKITEKQVDELISEAQKLSSENKTANNGKGLNLGIFENNEHIEYQITRIY